MKKINLKVIGYLKNYKFDQDKRVYDSNYLARTIKTNGGGNYQVMNIKKKVINDLLKSGLVKPYDVVEHSYTDNGKRELKNLIVSKDGIFPCMTTRPDCLGVTEMKKNEYTEIEKQLFTRGGHIKRYIGSDKVDQFNEGQMATTTFPNGYGHGPRTHNESIALNTIDRPSVKMNLRIRKLIPLETLKLMGFERQDEQAMRQAGMSDSAIYHCSGDSIVTTCLMALFGTMLPISEKELHQKIEDYVENIVGN